MGRFRVALADDVPELRRLLRHVLEWSDRFEVVGEADNGREAVAVAAELQPDLLLLDISMPVMDGMEALPQILEASGGTRVVMLSGFEAERLGQAALELGASGYVEKGTSPAALIDRLLELMEADEPMPPPEPLPQVVTDDPAPEELLDISPEEMMSLVAHEIRNPLAVIQGFGMELQNRWETMPDHQRRDAVRRMTERARYLNTVVNNLMYMRKIRSGQPWLKPSVEPTAQLIDRLRDELADMARDHTLEMRVGNDLPDVLVDVTRVRQVLTNLVVNAAKFSPAGAPIVLCGEDHPRGVALRVEDHGPGIPEDKHEEVFEKFRRLESGGSGIGLGLYISRALMRSLGGEMWIESSNGGGASLVCLLPKA
jgi:signal transduction histidine kinase